MALETKLVKEAGYALAEIRGEREVHRIREEPDGLVAALGRVTPRTVRLAMAGVLGLGILLAAETGLVGALVASVLVAVALHWVGELDAEATEVEHVVERPGMTEREVLQRRVLHDEHEQIKKEKAEEEHRKAKNKHKGGSP